LVEPARRARAQARSAFCVGSIFRSCGIDLRVSFFMSSIFIRKKRGARAGETRGATVGSDAALTRLLSAVRARRPWRAAVKMQEILMKTGKFYLNH